MSRSNQIPVYSTGTIAIGAVSGGYYPVTGVGTVWLSPDSVSNWTIAVGDLLVIPGVGFGWVGVAPSSNTALSLSWWNGGIITAGTAYSIYRYSGVAPGTLAGLITNLLALGSTANPFAALSALVGAGKINFANDGAGNILLQVRSTGTGQTDANYVTAFTISEATGVVTMTLTSSEINAALGTGGLAPAALPGPTSTTLGGVKPDTTATISGAGVLSDAVGFRNILINGDMRIDQRNNGASVTAAVNVQTFPVDRWWVTCSGAAVTAQRITGWASYGYPYILIVNGASGNTATSVAQRVESATAARYAGKSAVLSFTCNSATITSLSFWIAYPSALDNYASLASGVVTGTQAINSIATRYSVPVTIAAAATNGLEVRFYPTANALLAGQEFIITDVQLELGTQPTPFELMPYGISLALCQRYYFQTPTGICYGGYGGAAIAAITCSVSFPVTMRAVPTLAVIGSPTYANCSGYAVGSATTIGFYNYAIPTATSSYYFYVAWSALAEL